MRAPATNFRTLSPPLARAILLAVAAIAVILMFYAFPLQGPPRTSDDHGDLDTYAQVVERLRAGEPYYQALHTELVDGGYGTRSVFNWRPPFFLSALALSPSTLLSQGVLIALAAAGIVLGRRLVSETDSKLLHIGLSLMFVLCLMSVLASNAVLMCELYAGALILISVGAYGARLPWLAIAAGALALLFRELSILYLLVCLALALRDRRWREAAVWVAVLCAFSLYYGWHARMAMLSVAPTDRAYPDGWLQLGGVSFDLTTANFNGIFLLLPFWVTALMLPLSVLGLLSWPARAGERILLTVLVYLAAFAIVGKPVNIYWGALYTPLLSFGLVWSVPALIDLYRASLHRAPATA